MENKSLNAKGDLKLIAILLCGGALFSMHFGASSMVWPMNWGKESGTSLPIAFLGAAITSLLLVFVGYLALARSDETYSEMAQNIAGKRIGIAFTCLTIAVNGPLFVIPRMSAAAWDSIVQVTGLQTESKLWLILFTAAFYIATYFFVVNPGKTMDRISAFLFPFLIVIVIAVVVKGILFPLGESAPKTYDAPAFVYGFTNGYSTGDLLCALIFGSVILSNLREKGVEAPRLNKNMVRVGIAGIAMLSCTHLAHMIIGASSAATFPELNYTSLYTAVATALYGKTGGILFCAALFLAAFTTSVGMTSGCAQFFAELFPKGMEYKRGALYICLLSTLLGSLGLSDILAYLSPILDAVYPATIIIVLYYAFCRQDRIQTFLPAARLAFYGALIFGLLDMIWKYCRNAEPLQWACRMYLKLPLTGVSLGFVPWTVLLFAVGFLICLRKRKPDN